METTLKPHKQYLIPPERLAQFLVSLGPDRSMQPAGLDCTVDNENKYYEALTKSPQHFTWQVTAVIFRYGVG